MIKNGSGIPDPVLTQAMWGIRQEEKTREGEVNNGNNRMHISCDCSSRIYGNCMGGKRRVGGEADDKERFRNSRP